MQWVTQGTTFARQKAIWGRARAIDGNLSTHTDIALEFQDHDALSLESRYRPQEGNAKDGETDDRGDSEILGKIQQRLHMFEGLRALSGSLQEEQERELEPEIEQERQLERPAPAEAEQHSVHPDVLSFVKTGRIRCTKQSKAFIPAFRVFRETSAVRDFDLDTTPTGLLVTQDFCRTVKRGGSHGEWMDDYQRTVQWVLTDHQPSGKVGTMVVLSPFEANALMATIETSYSVSLHLFSPRQNEAFRPLDNLALYSVPKIRQLSIPDRLRIELMLFSGQLYFDNFEQYVMACDFLCLAYEASSESSVVSSCGFISPKSHKPDRDQATIFQRSPVKLLKTVLESMRRHGESIEKTHMGKVLGGVLLTRHDFRASF